jgi:hypothetical protein
MFDIDREVATWSAAVHAERCRSSAPVAELSDHLYCEIERARAEGLSDEAAFRMAIARVGSSAELTAEHAKNGSALGSVCQVAVKIDRSSSPEHRRLLLGHALVWAALIIVCAIVLKQSGASEVFAWLLIVAFVPLWLASDQLMQRALRTRRASGN